MGYIKEHWRGFKDFFINLWDDLTAPFKSFINMLIDGVNLVISGLNKINVTIPSWVPGIGGEDWGISIDKIPKFHDGGVFRTLNPSGEGLALLKDKETVLPEGVKPVTAMTIDYDRLARSMVSAMQNASFNTVLQLGNSQLTKLERAMKPIRISESGRTGG